MRKSILGCLLLVPLSAFAGDNCEHSKPLDLTLNLDGVRSVVFEVGAHDLKLDAAPNAPAELHGRACASDQDRLDGLSVTSRRAGDQLIVTMAREDSDGFSLFGHNYAHIELQGTLPDTLPVELEVGSGDAVASGVAELVVDVGSGDADIRQVAGTVSTSVGSGDIQLDRIGSLRVESIGSGDLAARRIAGDVRIGSIGSGDAELDDIGGNVEAGSIGSGDLDIGNVRGNLRVRSIGSGDVSHNGVDGDIDLPRER